jgi:hypothetical protein
MKTLEKAVVAKRNLMIKTQGKYYFVTNFFVEAERHILANIESPFIVKLHYAF